MKYYFIPNNPEVAYNSDGILDYMEENKISKLTVNIARPVKDIDYFWCDEFQQVGEKGNCGLNCIKYEPRNGKSGICKKYRFTYELTDNTETFKLELI